MSRDPRAQHLDDLMTEASIVKLLGELLEEIGQRPTTSRCTSRS